MFTTLFPTVVLGLAACQDYSYSEKTFSQTYVQEEFNSKADLVFVIDDSPSMAEEQELLGYNFDVFVDVVEGTYADWQAAVITTDVSTEEAGKVRGDFLSPDTPDLATAFIDAVSVGYRGSRDEQGLAAAALALSPDHNPGLVRPGAKLNVIILSDEDDHSPGTVDAYLQDCRVASGNGDFAFHAIVGDLPEGCASGTSAADPGVRYLEAAEKTDGYKDSICAEDYTEILTQIGLDLSDLPDTFVLADPVEQASLEVWVDEAIIPNRDRDGWLFDAAQNAVVFSGYAVPRPGMSIAVYYEMGFGTVASGDDTGTAGR